MGEERERESGRGEEEFYDKRAGIGLLGQALWLLLAGCCCCRRWLPPPIGLAAQRNQLQRSLRPPRLARHATTSGPHHRHLRLLHHLLRLLHHLLLHHLHHHRPRPRPRLHVSPLFTASCSWADVASSPRADKRLSSSEPAGGQGKKGREGG
eukprot:185959-Hanusia_phi.AAC.1